MKAKRRITQFNFHNEMMPNGKKTHVALVDEAANLTEALVIKSKKIVQQTTITEELEDGTKVCESDILEIEEEENEVEVTSTTIRVVETRHPKIMVV